MVGNRSYLCVPEMGSKIIALLPQLQGNDFVHCGDSQLIDITLTRDKWEFPEEHSSLVGSPAPSLVACAKRLRYFPKYPDIGAFVPRISSGTCTRGNDKVYLKICKSCGMRMMELRARETPEVFCLSGE